MVSCQFATNNNFFFNSLVFLLILPGMLIKLRLLLIENSKISKTLELIDLRIVNTSIEENSLLQKNKLFLWQLLFCVFLNLWVMYLKQKHYFAEFTFIYSI